MNDMYIKAYETVPSWWIHNQIAKVVTMGMGSMSLDDKRMFARWLRGFHAVHFRIDSVAHNWLTCPCEEFGRPVQIYLQRYLQVNWPFVSEAIPTLPDSPYEEIIDMPKPVEKGAEYVQGGLL